MLNEAVIHGVAAALTDNHRAKLTSPTWGMRRCEPQSDVGVGD